jgi:thiamine biosynthesis lipoprotein
MSILRTLALGLACAACGAPGARLERFSFARPAMGTEFRIVLYAADEARARAASQAAFARIDELERVLSDYDPESEASRLARAAPVGVAVDVSPDLYAVLARAAAVSRASDGAFDVTVGPLVRLWRRAGRQAELPSPERLAEAARAVGYAHLTLSDGRVALGVPGMRLDFGGIGKGYALDAALAALEARGVTRALVDGGGDVRVGAAPPGRAGWRVEVRALDVSGAPLVLELAHAALATSGDTERYVELAGLRYSHIVDPATGLGLTRRAAASVVAADGATADAWASAACVGGGARALGWAAAQDFEVRTEERAPGPAGDRTRVIESPGFSRLRLL